MSTNRTALLVMVIGLAVIVSILAAGAAFAVTRWGGEPMNRCVAAFGKAFGTTLMVLAAVLTVVITALK
ncbi:hypothetical protein AMK27_38255 [Streptomyces sp. CB02009]|uniref:hypothetical protein n=1 Tax=Streptomyces sp. CB02009 TaxID=1703938 RepID=UPI0009400034|nr:hypothetical protein [Streptomyces sp. CB02009]OKJ48618.1 hypothetical protein AMK27_38255 [Streptomyces sp. CB02009]